MQQKCKQNGAKTESRAETQAPAQNATKAESRAEARDFTIASFQKDHDRLQPGFYFSTLQKNVCTFDLRFKKPNAGDFLAQAALHSIEHMLATALRGGTYGEHILYFGPMGCRTGFYLLTEGMRVCDALAAVKSAIADALGYAFVPGAQKKEGGNYLEHDLRGAKAELSSYLSLLNGFSAEAIEREEARKAEKEKA